MEMERINDDTIRVLVTNDDLADRSISVIDLLGNQEEIEKFFRSILEEVDVDNDFAENEAVTFQVLPNRNGLELFISKNVENNNLMTDMMENIMGDRDNVESKDDVTDTLLEQLLGHDTSDDQPKRPRQKAGNRVNDATSVTGGPENVVEKTISPVILKFADFEMVIQLAQALRGKHVFEDSMLIEYHSEYFVELTLDTTLPKDELINITAIAREFGTLTPVAAEVLAEHGRVIFANAAIESVLKYFN
ncbi:adaptor protein MecA [Weissella soli]|uniref:Adapter protein MecA 1/2 n=4 Tax=Weissella soli TaxID=155866 RepID=A0A288QLE6_9LACO|nr:adaptor protein MecA [Weissella soli]AOT55956.1 Adapter protein MecA [Weissella soli]NKY83854.1 competence protein [Weissella soli]RDL01560.1 adapter protein MecA 1/2 [Weissella soli]GEN93769.1 adapter protein MecA [Weissella soli]